MDETDDDRWKSLAVAALAAMWAVALYGVLTLPPSIPVSWRSNGDVSYGSKLTVLMLPVVATASLVFLRFLRTIPNLPLNAPFTIPDDRRDAVNAVARGYLDVMAAAMILGFALLEAAIVLSSETGRLEWTFGASIAALMVLVFGTAAKMLADVYRASRP